MWCFCRRETHKALRRFKLRSVNNKWRNSFKKLFATKHGPYGSSGYRSTCSKGWRLIRRSNKNQLKRVRVKGYNCAKTLGGYLSTDGKYILLKVESYFGPTADSGSTFTDQSYKWIRL